MAFPRRIDELGLESSVRSVTGGTAGPETGVSSFGWRKFVEQGVTRWSCCIPMSSICGFGGLGGGLCLDVRSFGSSRLRHDMLWLGCSPDNTCKTIDARSSRNRLQIRCLYFSV